MESCLEVSFSCLPAATGFHISTGCRTAGCAAKMRWKQTFGSVIKSCKHFMTVIPGSVWCCLTISFRHWVKFIHFPALPRIAAIILGSTGKLYWYITLYRFLYYVTDTFWNLSLWAFFCTIFLHSFLSEWVYPAQSRAQAVGNDELHKET